MNNHHLKNDDTVLYPNGVSITGDYLLAPMYPSDLTASMRGERMNRDNFHYQDLHSRAEQQRQQHLGVAEHIDPQRIDESGWGVIFADGADPAVREALSELLNYRKHQATQQHAAFYRELIFKPNDDKRSFLARYGVGPGPINPLNGVPYYMLIVGDPQTIPYTFQYQLDVQCAVGRIHFETLDEYATYARSVVAAERGTFRLPRTITFAGTRNNGDRATQMSADHLIVPLAENITRDMPSWHVATYCGAEATKTTMQQILGGDKTPACAFIASHGMGFPLGDNRMLPHQGAILCQDWRGPGSGSITEDLYLAGEHIGSDARLTGLIAFLFACYGGGTPSHDEFYHAAFAERSNQIAPHAFVAGLPRRLLGHPAGGALAFVGHIERAWGYSFLTEGTQKRQIEVFDSMLSTLLQGSTIGAAMEYFNERYAEIATDLTQELEAMEFGKHVDEFDLAMLWTQHHDARNYIIIGDPAVRLPLADDTVAATERPPSIGSVAVPPHATTYIPYPTLPTPTQQPSISSTLAKRVAQGSVRAATSAFTSLDEITSATENITATDNNAEAMPTLQAVLARWQTARAVEAKARAALEQCLHDVVKIASQ